MAIFNVAVLGAESTGKSTLASAIVAQLNAEQKPAVLVPEYLREWCEALSRTPLKHEQEHIAVQQAQRLKEAQSLTPLSGLVIADTAPLITAVYSDIYFNDLSLYPQAITHHRSYDLTLLTGLDIAWIADGIQRDSEAVRQAVDQRLRIALAENGIAYATVYGQGDARTACALQAIAYKTAGLRSGSQSNWQWNCEKCSDADCEHRLFSRLTR